MMDTSKTKTIAAAGALAAGVAYLFSNRMKMNMRMTPDHRLAIEKTTEVARTPRTSGITGLAALAVGGLLYSQWKKNRGMGSSSSTVEQSIDVNVPVSTAYNQWTQFEEFPRFMETVEQVTQIDDEHLHWRATVAGKPKEWDAEITEQIPDQKIAWRSTSGPRNAGVVTFHKLGENKTRIMLQMDYEPESPDEKIGSAMGGVKLTAKGNLKKFKELIEQRGAETGAWRGTVAQQH
jgi:uncharacterized membrane protein